MSEKSNIYQYTVYFQPLPEGGYNVVVPAIPEIATFGETIDEAKANAKEAIACVLESSRKRQESIPQERKDLEFIREEIQVPLTA